MEQDFCAIGMTTGSAAARRTLLERLNNEEIRSKRWAGETRSSEGDSATLPETLTMAVEQVEAVQEADC